MQKSKFSQYAIYALIFCVLLFCGISAPAQGATSPELDSLEIEGDDGDFYLDEDDFDPEDTSYTIEIPDGLDYLDLTLDFDEDLYEVDVTSTTGDVDEKSSYWRVDTDDEGRIRITLTDEDDEETIYTIRVNYEDEDSSDGASELEDLHLNTGAEYSTRSARVLELFPEFDYEITDYVALLPYYSDVAYLNLRFSLEDENVELAIGNQEITLEDDYYDYQVAVNPGNNIIVEFTVEGEEYTLTIYCAPRNGDDDAYLDDLAIRTRRSTSSSYEVDLTPDFDEDETAYVLPATASGTLYLYAEADSDMLILVNDQVLGSYWTFDPAKTSQVEVMVYAENLEDSTTYTITPETDLELRSLSLSGYNLSPYFSASQHSYTVQVPTSISSITLNAAATNSSATLSVALNGGSYSSFSGSSAFTLSEGLNTFDIRLSANGVEDHYYVNVYRPASVTTIATSSQTMRVNNGSTTAIAAYNINGNNFVKLRDVAQMLSGTAKQFAVSFNATSNQVYLTSGAAYSAIGGELTIPGAYTNAIVTRQTVLLNNSSVTPMAYNIDGNNYFLLRDLAALFDFGISYSGTTVIVDTAARYSYTR